MSATRDTTHRPPADRRLRWGGYLVILFAVLGLLAILAAATIARPATTDVGAPEPLVVVLTPTSIAASGSTPAPTPTPAATPLPEAAQTATYEAACGLVSQVPRDLLVRVDRDTALPNDFEPDDLAPVPLDRRNVYYGQTLLRQAVHQPLLDLLEAMNQADLQVLVMSGYRSYVEQTLANEKWQQLYPERSVHISALPGHSEHQLGTAVDFSTPYMYDQFRDFFHTDFAETKEGQWLNVHAPYYGFTLSYPLWGVQQTGYNWEPWHYRYVGLLAQQLRDGRQTLTQYIQQCTSP